MIISFNHYFDSINFRRSQVNRENCNLFKNFMLALFLNFYRFFHLILKYFYLFEYINLAYHTLNTNLLYQMENFLFLKICCPQHF